MSVGRLVYLIYKLKVRLNVKSEKTLSVICSKRDSFLEKNQNSEIYKFYKLGIDKLKRYDLTFPIYSKEHIIYNGN